MQDLNSEATSPIDNTESPVFRLNLSSLISSLDEKLEQDEDSIIATQDNSVPMIMDSEPLAIESFEQTAIKNTPAALEISGIAEELSSEDSTLESFMAETKPTDADEFLKMIQSIKPETLISISTETEAPAIDQERFNQEMLRINSERKHRKIIRFIVDQTKFLANYIVVSVLVFFVLLGVTNYSAYSTIAYNYINPNSLKNSSKEILNVIDNSKIKVFADEDTSLLGNEQQKTIQKSLAEDNTQLRDTYFSPKKLVPLKSNVNLSVEIVPYENRLIIPKIGKNIPLVDVDARRGNLDFVNLENIFMSELEKGVLRYPGTAKPGENGVSFIFGHSSNYPWLKGEYNEVFAMLDNLVMGDEIIVYYNQKKYTYVINEKKVIKPGNLKILERDPSKKELSLMTCWPIGTSLNRLITFAELKSVN